MFLMDMQGSVFFSNHLYLYIEVSFEENIIIINRKAKIKTQIVLITSLTRHKHPLLFSHKKAVVII